MSHAIEPKTLNQILQNLDLAEKIIRESHGAHTEDVIQFGRNITTIKNALQKEREWFVISVLHRTRPIDLLDGLPLLSMTDEEMTDLADNIANDQDYDDALDSTIYVRTRKFLKNKGLIKKGGT